MSEELPANVAELRIDYKDSSKLLDSMEIAILFLDRAMHVKQFNLSAAKLLNLQQTDIERALDDSGERTGCEYLAADIQQVLSKRILVERVVSSTVAAQPRSYLRRIVAHRINNDWPAGVVIAFVDITRRHQLEKSLAQRVIDRTDELNHSNEQLSLLLFAAGAAVWEMDRHRNRQPIWQDIHRAMFGELPAADNDSWQWWLQKIHPDQRRQVETSLTAAIAGADEHWQRQYRFRMADGTDHWIADSAHIARDTAGKAVRITGVMMDIDKHKQLEIELADREQRLAAILQYTSEAYLVIDNNGLITDHNIVAEQVFGYCAEQLVGRDICSLIPAACGRDYEQNIAGHGSIDPARMVSRRREFFGLRKDGSTFPLEITVTEIERIGVFIALIRDLSEHRLLEKEISNISTWEQEKTGRELHDGLGQRLTGLNMLAAHVKNRLEQRGLPEAALLKDIIAQLKAAAEEVSRISHGLAPISITPDGLADALARLVEQVGDGVGADCRFNNRSSGIISNQAAANQIYRIAQEAFNNALKYAEADHITLALDDDDEAIALTISDDGIGFDMAELMKRDGFGIRIMRYRASSVGATLSIDTAPGNGTRVCLTYPYQDFPDIGML